MSYAICRIQKIGSGANVIGIQIHNERQRKSSNTNPDIDYNRSSDNYSIIPTNGKSYNTLADERIAQDYTVKKAIRKDAVKVCEVLFTSDNEFFDKTNHKAYFKACYEWACTRFGKDNIISATVHMDENTPHMHIDFVPLTSDGRLSAKAVIGGKFDLQRMQDDFYEKIGKPFGLERGERADLENQETKKPRKHLETADYKRQQEIEKLKQQIDKLKSIISTYQELKIDVTEVDNIGKKSLIGKNIVLNPEDFALLQEQAKAYRANRDKIENINKREQALNEKEQNAENVYQQKIKYYKSKEAHFKLREEIIESNEKKTEKYLKQAEEIWDIATLTGDFKDYIADYHKMKDIINIQVQQIENATNKVNNLQNQLKNSVPIVQYETEKQNANNYLSRLQAMERELLKYKQAYSAEKSKNIEKDKIIEELKINIGTVSVEKDKQIFKLKALSESIYECLANIVIAVKTLNSKELTTEQARLIKSITDYSIDWAKSDGFTNIANKIQTKIGISDGIQEKIEFNTPRQSHYYGLGR